MNKVKKYYTIEQRFNSGNITKHYILLDLRQYPYNKEYLTKSVFDESWETYLYLIDFDGANTNKMFKKIKRRYERRDYPNHDKFLRENTDFLDDP